MNALLDSNVLIYASQPTGGQARDFIRNNTVFVSAVSQIEVLGYHKLNNNQNRRL